MANTFVGGTAGRVKVDGVVIAGIKTWRLDQVTAEIPLPNFESTVDALGRVWPDYLAGLSGATGTFEGYFDVNASNPTDDAITVSGTDSVSAFYTLQLFFQKSSLWGFEVTVLITSFGSGTNVENQPATFTANFRITGVVPLTAPLS